MAFLQYKLQGLLSHCLSLLPNSSGPFLLTWGEWLTKAFMLHVTYVGLPLSCACPVYAYGIMPILFAFVQLVHMTLKRN